MPGSVSQNENILKYCKNKEVPQSVAPVAPVAPSVAPSGVHTEASSEVPSGPPFPFKKAKDKNGNEAQREGKYPKIVSK